MKVELTDKEIVNLGANRWIRKNWIKLALSCAIPLIALAVAAGLIPKDFNVVARWAVYIILLAGFIYFYWYFFVVSDRIGKKFLKDQKAAEVK